MKNSNKRKRAWIIAAAFAVIMGAAFYCRLTVRQYTIVTAKVSSPITVVAVSDLHSYIFKPAQQPLISKIKKQNPDIILLVGDIIDDDTPIDGAKLFFEGIKDIAPVFYVTGNHEYWTNQIDEVISLVQSYGVTVLSDSYEGLDIGGNKIIIGGVDDPAAAGYKKIKYNQIQSMENAFADLTGDSSFNILLAHRPERIETYMQFPFDLIVNGHAHGGQVRLPFFINGVYAPNQGLFPAYAGGVYVHDEKIQIVSRGLVLNLKLPRIFNPPEIWSIHIKPE